MQKTRQLMLHRHREKEQLEKKPVGQDSREIVLYITVHDIFELCILAFFQQNKYVNLQLQNAKMIDLLLHGCMKSDNLTIKMRINPL
jgi:hypothetical protein